MSEEQPADPPVPAAAAEETPREPVVAATETEPGPSPSREEAAKELLGDASKLANVRFTKIISEGNSRLEGAATVNIFHGDITVDGDFVAGPGGRQPGRRATKVRIDPSDVEKTTEYFVRPGDFGDGVDILADTNLLVISGPSGTGRYVRALATLREVLGRNNPAADIFPVTSSALGNPSWRIPQSRSGLVLRDAAGSNGKCSAERLSDDWLARTSERLRDTASYLVVITGPVSGTLATASKRAEFVVEDLELPEPVDIVRRRVSDVLPGVATDLEARLTDTSLAEALAERDDPRFAVRAAAAIVEVFRSAGTFPPGEDLAEIVRRLNDPEDQVREWLSRDPDLADIALVLATAVLEGASYLNVADAAMTLYRSLAVSTSSLTPRYLRRILAERDWIELVEAADGDHGTPQLKFKYPRLRVGVLGVTWFELDAAREKILTWLRELAQHTDVEVRARAAQAAGILASNDFEHGVHRYLLSWGGDTKSSALRQSAAYGLNVAGTIGAKDEAVWSYVEQWAALAGNGKNRALPATAGLAAGGELGVKDPRRALRVLRTLVREGDWGLLEPVAMGTQTLLEAGCAVEVLEALTEWTEPSEEDEALGKALMMFAFTVFPEDSSDELPLLLREAGEHRDALPELWGRALANESARDLARDALRSWVRITERDEAVSSTVLDVIAGIADRGSTDFDRILHVLRGWALDRDEPSPKAAEFHDILADLEEEAS